MWVVKVKGTACPTRILPLRALEQGPYLQTLQWSCAVAADKPVAVLPPYRCECVPVSVIRASQTTRTSTKNGSICSVTAGLSV